MSSPLFRFTTLAVATALLVGCSSLPNPLKRDKSPAAKNTTELAEPQIGVNKYLWRSSLETLDFMPMAQIDPYGGVILTEWYSNPEIPNERFKVNVYILDTQLRADALKVGVFKQTRGQGGWVDASVDADTARQIENSILTKARELYIASN